MENRGDESLYVYLYRCVRRDIESGAIAPDQRLPSKRALAKHLGVSVITVEGAYAQLEAEGYIRSAERRGYYANAVGVPSFSRFPATPRPTEPALGPRPSEPARQEPEPARQEPTSQPPLVADFTGSVSPTGLFPYALWARTVREVLTEASEQALVREASPTGSPRLRAALASYLRGVRGMEVDPSQIVVGAGAQMLYNLIVQLLGRDRRYAVENPGYPRLTHIYQANDAPLSHVPLDGEGIAMEGLRASGASVVHVMPSHQYPTGLVTSVGRRYGLLAWANEGGPDRRGRYVVEDDYDCEFRLAGRPIPALQSIDATGRVIYTNTFAKSLGPAFRLGYMVLPPQLSREFEERLGFYSCTVSAIEQLALARFIECGDYERHVGRTRSHYRVLRDELVGALRESSFGDRLVIEGADAGLHFVMGVRDVQAGDRAVAEKARGLGVALAPLSGFAEGGSLAGAGPWGGDCRWFVMSYGGVAPEKIAPAVAVLEQTFRA